MEGNTAAADTVTRGNAAWLATTREKDIKYFVRNLEYLPEPYTSADPSRMSMLYFCILALDALGALDTLKPSVIQRCIDWIYAMQVLPANTTGTNTLESCGFRGAPYMGSPFSKDGSPPHTYMDDAHVTMTQTALSSLLMLGDDLARVNMSAIVDAISKLQQSCGGFAPHAHSTEVDIRFMYSACVVCSLLGNWGTVNKKAAIEHILQRRTFDGAFSNSKFQEAQAGFVFCAVASLYLLDGLGAIDRKEQLVEWLLLRQNEGFNGRPNKASDTCYCFWVGSTLKVLESFQYVDLPDMHDFLKTTHSDFGGFGKNEGAFPDLMHSSLGFIALANNPLEENLGRINTALGITEKSASHLLSLKLGRTSSLA